MLHSKAMKWLFAIVLAVLTFSAAQPAFAVEHRIFQRDSSKIIKLDDGSYVYATDEWGPIIQNEPLGYGLVPANVEIPPASNQLRCVYDSFNDIVNNKQKYSPELENYLKTLNATKTAHAECRSATAVDSDFYAINADLSKFFDPHEQAIALQLSYGRRVAVYVNVKPRFKDVPIENSYWDEIDYLAKRSIINGKGNGTFAPKETLKKTQVASMIARALQLDKKYGANYAFTHSYTDVPKNHYAYLDIMRVTEAGIFDKTTTFNGLNGFTRGEMAIALTRAFDIQGYAGKPKAFTDIQAGKVTQELYEAVQTLSKYSIAQGNTNNRFMPNELLTRQHFAVFMARTLVEDAGFRYIYTIR